MQENCLLDLMIILIYIMPRYYFKAEGFQLLLLSMEQLMEEIKYWQMLELLRCMANKENICSDYNNRQYMDQTSFILTLA